MNETDADFMESKTNRKTEKAKNMHVEEKEAKTRYGERGKLDEEQEEYTKLEETDTKEKD